MAAALRGASLRTRVMAAAALLVVLISLVTAVLGTTLLRSYLLSKSDAQLRDFATVASRIVQRQRLQPAESSGRPQSLPTQFLVEVVSADGKISMAGGPAGRGGRAAAVRRAAQPDRNAVHRAGHRYPGGSWRVLVQRLTGGSHLVIAYSLGDLDAAVTRLEVADALAGASPSSCWQPSACRWCGPA